MIMDQQNTASQQRTTGTMTSYRAHPRGCIYLEDGSVCLTDEVSSHHFINALERLAERIAAVDNEPVELVQTRLGPRFQLTSLGADVWHLSKSYDPLIKRRFAHQVFNPYIAVALRAYRRWNEALQWGRTGSDLDLRFDAARSALNRLVRVIRWGCRTARFKTLVKNYKRSAAKSFRNCVAYMAALFGRCSRLLILRVDLYYRPEGMDWGDTASAAKGFDKFMRALREERIVPDLVGYIAKREKGYQRGMHYHVLVALDGHKHREGATYARMLGQHWVEHCTGPRKVGSYFNCHSREEDYRFNGLGLVHFDDAEKCKGLLAAIRYLTKANHQLKTGRGKGRNLRKGEMPKANDAMPRRGAPRKTLPDINGAFKRVFLYRPRKPRRPAADEGLWVS